MSTNLAPVIQELHRAHAQIQTHIMQHVNPGYKYYKNHPPEPVITIERRGRKHTDSWFEPESWDKEGTAAVNLFAGQQISCNCSITIAAEILGQPTHTILSALMSGQLLHTAYHNQALNHMFSKGYYSQNYATRMALLGLVVERDTSGGWRLIKEVKQKAAQLFTTIALDPTVFDLFRKEDPGKQFKGSGLKKWACACTNIRASVYLEANCEACGKPFEYEDKDKNEPERQHWLKSLKATFQASRTHSLSVSNTRYFRAP